MGRDKGPHCRGKEIDSLLLVLSPSPTPSLLPRIPRILIQGAFHPISHLSADLGDFPDMAADKATAVAVDDVHSLKCAEWERDGQRHGL